MSDGRNQYMANHFDSHVFSTKGEAYKAEPSRAEMDAYCLAVREANYHYGKQHGLKQQLKPRVDVTKTIGAPLDYCYLDIKDLSELPGIEPNSGKRKPRAKDTPEGGFLPQISQKKSERRVKQVVTSVKLGYNELTNLNGMEEALQEVMENPEENLTLVDLSHNKFSTVPDLSRYQNLTVVYLHGNLITKLKEVKKLAKLPNLQKLTLNGNDVFYEATETSGRRAEKLEETPYYRHQIIYYLRNTQLKSLDNTPITPKDRENALIWYQNFCPTRPNKKKLPDPTTMYKDYVP
jgi:Leucine-rich repeat (LRR) protein